MHRFGIRPRRLFCTCATRPCIPHCPPPARLTALSRLRSRSWIRIRYQPGAASNRSAGLPLPTGTRQARHIAGLDRHRLLAIADRARAIADGRTIVRPTHVIRGGDTVAAVLPTCIDATQWHLKHVRLRTPPLARARSPDVPRLLRSSRRSVGRRGDESSPPLSPRPAGDGPEGPGMSPRPGGPWPVVAVRRPGRAFHPARASGRQWPWPSAAAAVGVEEPAVLPRSHQ